MCDYLLVCICVCVAQTGRISKSSYASMSVCDLVRVLCLYEFHVRLCLCKRTYVGVNVCMTSRMVLMSV